MTEKAFMAKDRYGASMEFVIRAADRKASHEADMNYRIAYGEAIKLGLLPREKIRQILKDHKIWTEEDEKSFKETLLELAKLELELKECEHAGKKDGAILAAGKLAASRNKLWELTLIQQMPFTNSCEAYADLVRMESEMAANVVIKATGKRYWGSYKEYVIERDTNLSAEVATKASEIIAADLLEQRTMIFQDTPEQVWLKNQKINVEEAEIKAQAELQKRATDGADVPTDIRESASNDNQKAPA